MPSALSVPCLPACGTWNDGTRGAPAPAGLVRANRLTHRPGGAATHRVDATHHRKGSFIIIHTYNAGRARGRARPCRVYIFVLMGGARA
eukprot:3836383-Pyramimonas_sp.AAC.1